MQSGPPTGWSPEGVRKIDRCNVFFHRGRTSSNEPGNRSSRNREKKPKTFLVHRIEPGCSPIDRMQSGPPTGWSPEGVRKIDRCNVFFHRGRTSSNEPGNRSSRNREKNPKHSWFTGSNPDACSPTDRMQVSENRSVQCFFHRTSSNEPGNRSSREKKTQNIPDRIEPVSNRPDANRLGRCPESIFFHRGRTSSNEPRSTETEKKNPKHSWFTGSKSIEPKPRKKHG